jgi:hypothetical protein
VRQSANSISSPLDSGMHRAHSGAGCRPEWEYRHSVWVVSCADLPLPPSLGNGTLTSENSALL